MTLTADLGNPRASPNPGQFAVLYFKFGIFLAGNAQALKLPDFFLSNPMCTALG
jgi:hypothetical protein